MPPQRNLQSPSKQWTEGEKRLEKIIGDRNRERKEEIDEDSVTSHFPKWQSIEIRILSGREGLEESPFRYLLSNCLSNIPSEDTQAFHLSM